MSFKPIDLQTSLPRTAEMSPLAAQQQNRPQAEQAMLSQEMMKRTQQQRQRTPQTESPEKGEITERDGSGSGGQQEQGKKRSGKSVAEQENNKPEHPFKGKHIDFKG